MKAILIRLWRKLFGVKTGVYETIHSTGDYLTAIEINSTYDPSEDSEKIMMGEVESYFD